MTAGLNAVPLPQVGRASAMSNVMRQVFGAMGTAIVVTILQQRFPSQGDANANVVFHASSGNLSARVPGEELMVIKARPCAYCIYYVGVAPKRNRSYGTMDVRVIFLLMIAFTK